MDKPIPETLNEAIGIEVVQLGLFIQTSNVEVGSAVGFIKYEGKDWVVKVQVMDPLEAFGPEIDF
jgi:hypothetical protein